MNKKIVRAAGFEKEVKKVEKGICPICDNPIRMTDFRDNLSLKEYKISGLCQTCMDDTFGT